MVRFFSNVTYEYDNRNILRDDSGHLKVADFGVSKLLTVKEDKPLNCLETSCECYFFSYMLIYTDILECHLYITYYEKFFPIVCKHFCAIWKWCTTLSIIVTLMTQMSLAGRYVAPEVFKHEEYDTKVDVFSFALILQEVKMFILWS